MKILLTFLMTVSLFITTAQGMGENMNNEKMLLKLDKEIAAVSAEKGILKAIYPYLTKNSILLPENGHPVYGKDACAALMNRTDISGWEGKLQWEPTLARVSNAGDMGFTHGRFDRRATGADGIQKTTTGYYGIIWPKNKDGNWKVMVAQGILLLKDLGQKPVANQIAGAALDDIIKEVVAVEHAFSEYSVKNGIADAFHRYIADDGIALSSSGPPRTKEVYAKVIAAAKEKKQQSGSKAKLEWEPFFSRVSASGDMAYNYGPYIYTLTSADGKTQQFYGYFCTVWKKQRDNTWKFVFDGGNESPTAAGNFP